MAILKRGWWWLLAAVAVVAAGCNQEKPPEVANKFRPAAPANPSDPAKPDPAAGPNDKANPAQPTTDPPAGGEKQPAGPPAGPMKDPLAVPEGPPAKQMEFIGQLEQKLAQVNFQAEQLGAPAAEVKQVVTMIRQAQLKAAEKVLANKDAAADLVQAATMKLMLLQQLNQMGAATTPTAYQDYLDSLVKHEDPQLAVVGQVGLLSTKIDALMTKARAEQAAAPEEEQFKPSAELIADAEKLAKEIEALLAIKEVSTSVLEMTMQGAVALTQAGQFRNSAAMFEKIRERFKDDKDERTAFRVARLAQQPFVVRLVGLANGDETLLPEVMAGVKGMLAAAPDEQTFSVMQQALTMLEMSGHVVEAKQLVAEMQKGYAETKSEELKQTLATLAEKALKRLELVGKPIVIEGVKAKDGKPFDWAEYQGKVVLVDLWATWCRPCLEEIPNVLKNYDKYHAQGFEVVGVNLDDEPEALPKFNKQVPQIFGVPSFPWATVVQNDLNHAGMEKDPNAMRFGVEGIPFMLLVGRDGKVIALHPRGKRLGQLLAKEFPAATPESPAPSTPEKKPAEEKTGQILDGATFVLFADDPPAAAPAAEAPAAEPEANPYSPDPELTTPQLIEFLFRADDKPKTIRTRPGFCEAVVEACDRILAAQPSAKQREIAATTKCVYLHRDASLGDEKADKLLAAFIVAMKDETNPAIARWVKLVTLEQEALGADKLDKAKLPELIAKLQAYFAAETLDADHLRLASACVGAINLIEDGKIREKHFAEIGKILAKSKDKQLASYGKKLAKPPEEGQEQSDLVGKPLELKGQTVEGKEFAWKEYRGKYVLVDFWATWCGPCKREMPNVKALYEKYKEKNVEVVGVSLDEDVEDLKAYIEENQIPWTTLNGEDASNTAKEYGVRGIPTFMLIDPQGKILGVGHAVAPLEAQLAKLVK